MSLDVAVLMDFYYFSALSGRRIPEKGGKLLINRFPLSLSLSPPGFEGGGRATLQW
jgi:hypothetical protein